MSEPSPTRPSIGRTIATLCFSIVAAASFLHLDHSPPVGVWLSAIFLAIAPFLNRRVALGPQIIARALWWQAGLLGVLIFIGGPSRNIEGVFMAFGAAGALLAAGKSGLGNGSTSFLPVAFRRTLMLSLIFAIADFEALLLYGAIFFEESSSLHRMLRCVPFFAAAGAMGVSIFGLYRLKVWGLVACLVSNVAVAGCALAGVFDLPTELVAGLCATAIAQLLLPLPLIREMMRTKRLVTAVPACPTKAP